MTGFPSIIILLFTNEKGRFTYANAAKNKLRLKQNRALFQRGKLFKRDNPIIKRVGIIAHRVKLAVHTSPLVVR